MQTETQANCDKIILTTLWLKIRAGSGLPAPVATKKKNTECRQCLRCTSQKDTRIIALKRQRNLGAEHTMYILKISLFFPHFPCMNVMVRLLFYGSML